MQAILALGKALLGSLRDLLPIVLVIAFFQLVVLQEPLPNLFSILAGLVLVVVGLTFFIFGLEMGLFPIGESMAQALLAKVAYSGYLFLHFAWVLEPQLLSLHLLPLRQKRQRSPRRGE